MNLSKSDITVLLEGAIAAAKAAGGYISLASNQPIKVDKKVGGESLASQVVTEVDQKSQDIILSQLFPLSQKYDLGLLTEELEDDKSRLVKDYFWCIDPLDGTLPFTEGVSGYAVSIALVSKEGIPVVGVVYDPYKQNLYSGFLDGGAFKNGEPWQIDSTSEALTFITDRSFLRHPLFPAVNSKLKELGVVNTIQHGGAVMNALWVAEQQPACYFKYPKKTTGGGSFWDYAATTCILQEVGIQVTDMYGDPLALNSAESTFLNQKGIAIFSDKRLRETLTAFFKTQV